MTKTPQLLLPEAYVKDATERIRKAVTVVSFLSMLINDDPATDELIDALADAAKRGVEVHVAADMFTYSELSGQFIPAHYYSKRVRSTTRMARKLNAAGVHFHWLGRLNITTVSGRTHAKWCVVDDAVYAFGGVNLYEEGISNTDYMFEITDTTLARKLVDEHKRIVKADRDRAPYRSHSIPFGDDSVLIDGGFFGDSIIYRHACELTREAKNVTLVSQYCPTGKLSKFLKQANTKLYFNHWQHASVLNQWVIRFGMWVTQQTTLYNRSRYIHAKFMIFEMKDGRKVAITGSHNFVHGGVLLGTREIALQTENPAVIAQLETFLANHIA